MDQITLRPGENGRLVVLFAYAAELIEKIKTVPGRRWHASEKHWSVPDDPATRERLAVLFAEPNAPALPADASFLDKVRAAIRIRHLSPCTEEAYVGWTDVSLKFRPDLVGVQGCC